jgi:hypothetical protein
MTAEKIKWLITGTIILICMSVSILINHNVKMDNQQQKQVSNTNKIKKDTSQK